MKLMVLFFAIAACMTACGNSESLTETSESTMNCCSHPKCACPEESDCHCN